MLGRLANKVAIVTGSSSGIGRAICLAYSREGARVVCADVQPHTGGGQSSATHEHITESGGDAVFVKVDVSDAEQVESLVKSAVSTYGRLDIMVNNAGIGMPHGKRIWDLPLASWKKVQEINSSGVFYGIKYASAQMIAQEPLPLPESSPSSDLASRGWIINTASILGLSGQIGASDYCASKGAVVNLTRAAAMDCASHGIHVNAVAPGYTATHMTAGLFDDGDFRGKLEAKHPFKGLGRAEDLVGACVFLASEESRWISGITLPVDGAYMTGKV